MIGLDLSHFLLPTVTLLFVSGLAADAVMTYSFTEEQVPDTFVCDLLDDFSFRSRYNQSVLDQLSFAFLVGHGAGVDRPYFAIDEATAVIRSTHRIDREKICPRTDDCEMRFDIVVKPIAYFEMLNVKITIIDLNDNSPAFPTNRFQYELSEAAELLSSFVIPGATDMDSGENAICRHRIDPPNGIFELKVLSTLDEESDLRLVLVRKLDREEEDRFPVTVYAMDCGSPPRTGSMIVEIRVQDANDNNPEFDNATYEISVNESFVKGNVLLRVHAVDRDIGSNGIVVYDFSKHTTHEYGHLFSIERNSGKIFLQRPLDYENKQIHLLSVTAIDQGPDSLPSHASVVIRVEDVNDNAPQISIHTLAGDGHSTVAENSELGMFVAHVSVTDADSGENSRCYCSIDNPHFLLERIPERISERKQTTEFNLVTATRFDREKKDVYLVTVTCRDNGLRAQTSSAAPLQVRIADVNDNSPRFQTETIAFEIRENSPVGTEIGRVEARDKDFGENAAIVYAIEGSADQQLLTINKTTGIITTQVILDHERSVGHTFNVVAKDRGDPPRSVILRVALTILDEDDERPTFSTHRYVFMVYENQPPGTEVGQVVANDRDSAPFDRFIYFVDRRSKSLSLFEIEARTGNIKTKQVLDRENSPVHYLTIVVSPDSDPTYSATASVTITIGDMNDNKPRFLYPATNNETVTVSSQTPRGYAIKHIKGSDPDAGQNGNLTYTMTKGNPKGGMLLLDPQTGSLLVNADLSAIDFQEVFLSLLIQDGGSPSLSTTGELRIVISKDVPFIEKNRRQSMLANESMVVVLAITLAAILVAITVITVVIVLVRMEDRRRKAKVKQSLVTNGEAHSTIDSPMPFHVSDVKSHHPAAVTAVCGLQSNGIKSTLTNCQVDTSSSSTSFKRMSSSADIDEDIADPKQRLDGRSGGGGGGGKPVVVFIKDQRDGEGYFYGNQDSEEDEEEDAEVEAETEEQSVGFCTVGAAPQTTYALRLFDTNVGTRTAPPSVQRIGSTGNEFCPTIDGSGSEQRRYIQHIITDGRMPSFRFGGLRSTAATGSDKAPDGTKGGFFDRTFPTRKPFHGGCKIGDLHHLSRHSYSDLDCRYDGSSLIKSTTTSSLRVHFALEEDSAGLNFDCSRLTAKAPHATLPSTTLADRNYGYCGQSGRTKAFRMVNGSSCSSVHNDYEV